MGVGTSGKAGADDEFSAPGLCVLFSCALAHLWLYSQVILLFKLFTAPILIAALTWATRRYGTALVGLLIGIPLLTGPISAIVAWEQGAVFAAQAATSNLVGQVSTCLFCLAYWAAARRGINCWFSAVLGILTFVASTALWSTISWTLPTALLLLISTILLLLQIMRPVRVLTPLPRSPAWDLPTRMLLSALFVLGMTTLTRYLGPSLGGLLAPFPVFVLIFSTFTYRQAGYEHAANLLRGIVLGSSSFMSFFVVVAFALPVLNPVLVYAAATVSSLLVSAMLHRFKKR